MSNALALPDPDNGIVTIAKAKSGGHVYHTRQCMRYPDTPKPRKQAELPDDYRECKHCSDEIDREKTGHKHLECPFCGEADVLANHLPCEESP